MRVSKLSEIKGAKAIDAFAALLNPVFSIASDPVAVDFFAGGKKQTRVEKLRGMAEIVQDHWDEFLEIEAIKRGVTSEECKEEISVEDIFSGSIELLTDDLFLTFFVLAYRDGIASTCAQEATTEPNA